MDQPVAVTTAGAVGGLVENGIRKFLGVPYAAAPTGTLRFQLPQPHAPWEGVRDATTPGPTAPQIIRDLGALDPLPLVGGGWVEGDDFLSLNVWAPETAEKLPVMVFIHGGAFVGGSKDAPVNDGTSLARAGVVCMAMNYRLGTEGFLPIPGAPANLGLHDQLEALLWIKANAAAFGGDPDNVTVFGESAGAMSLANLLASPLSKGLFRRAIIQSGHVGMVRPRRVAKRAVERMARELRIEPTLEGFRSRSPAECLEAQEKISQPNSGLDLRDERGLEPAYGLSKFLPVWGDEVMPEPPLELLRKGCGADVQLLIGTNRDEMNIYFVPTRIRQTLGNILSMLVLGKSIRNARRILKLYGLGKKGRKGGEALTDAMTDLVFRAPARTTAAAHQGRTHMYEFEWRSPAYEGQMGACHALELPFVFGTLESCSAPRGIAGPNPPRELSERMQRLWVDFARDGSLPWPEYTAETRQVFQVAENRVIVDPPMPAADFLPQ